MLRGTWVATQPYALFRLRGSHSLRPPFPGRSAKQLRAFALLPKSPAAPATPSRQRRQALTPAGFGLGPVRSPLLGASRFLSFPRATEMFQFTRCPSLPYGFRQGCLGITPGGFPHSGIPGSTSVCDSPGRFAAYCALLRLKAPRHPPCALSSLTYL